LQIQNLLAGWPAQTVAAALAGSAAIAWLARLPKPAPLAGWESPWIKRPLPLWLHALILSGLGAAWVIPSLNASLGDAVQGAFLLAVLYSISIVDLETLEVPLAPAFLGILVRFACVMTLERESLLATVLGTFTGAGVLALVGLAYEWLRGHPGLGQGDTAVLGLVGAYVGWQGLIPALMAAAIAGLLGGGGVLLYKRKALNSPLPFGPFLAAGGWGVYVAQAAGWLPGAGN